MIRAETQTDLIRVNDGAQGIQGPKGDKGDTGAQGIQGPQGETGAAGESIASITNYYLATAASSGVNRETSGWTTTIQTMDSTKQYLWNYEVVIGDKGSTLTTTNPVIIGRYGLNGGTGKGISSITEYYLASAASSGITTSSAGWTTTVQTTDATNKYLWNYEVIAYTSGNPYTSAPRIIGTYGDKGDKGDTGSQGPQGIQGIQGVQGPKGDTPEITATKSGGATVISVDGDSIAVINDGAKGDKGDKGDTPEITATKSGTTTTIKVDGATVATVNDGTNGSTPTITTTKSGTTTTIYADGTAIGTVVDGDDGNTPTITATKSGTTTTIKVDGTTIATIADGAKGDTGATGPQGPQGIQGIQGPQGADGNDASISVSKSGSTATITAVSGDGTTTSTTVNDGTNGKSAYQSAVDGGYTGTENNFNSDLADVSNKAPLTIIREYNNGVLVGKTGQTVGALVNANGTFDVVGVNWSDNTPTAGDSVASFGTSTVIGVPHNNRLLLNSHSMKLIDNSDNEYFVIDDVRDEYGETTVVETHQVFQLHRGMQGDCHWVQNGINKIGTEYPISSVSSIKINGVELDDFTQITVDKNDTLDYRGTCVCMYDGDIPIFDFGDDISLGDTTTSSSSDGNSWDNWNLTTLPNGKTIIDNDEDSEFTGISMGSVAKRPYLIQGASKVTINDLTLLDIPTGYQQIALSEIEITYTTNSSYSLQYLTFGSRKAPVTIRTGSISLGYDNDVSGFYSYGEGYQVVSSGYTSHAEGYKTKATAQEAHAEGDNTTASSVAAHAEGNRTYATGFASHAEGLYSQATDDCSHAQNRATIAQRYDETVIGSYNAVDGYDVWKINTAYAVGDIAIYEDDMYSCHTAHTSTNSFRTDEGTYWTRLRKAGRALIIGNGTTGKRSNAAIIDWNGNYMGQGMAGMVQMFAGATVPDGWLLCDGSEYNIADYPELNDALGGDSSAGTAATLWGTAASGKFKVPDMRGRAPIGAGQGTGLTDRTLGTQNIGSETHALTAAQTGIRNHTHTYSDYNTTYTLKTTNRKPGTSTAVAYGTGLTAGGGATTRTSNNPAAEASGAAHPNMQPSAVLNFIIATGNTHA